MEVESSHAGFATFNIRLLHHAAHLLYAVRHVGQLVIVMFDVGPMLPKVKVIQQVL